MLNNRPRNVRERAATAPQRDRRVVRTRVALGHALVELMLEREFDEITVQQVLDRANVGRATFGCRAVDNHLSHGPESAYRRCERERAAACSALFDVFGGG